VSSKQPFLDLSEVGADHARLLGLDVLNRGASAMESALGRRLYPFRQKLSAYGSPQCVPANISSS